jgi:hypothetical protein
MESEMTPEFKAKWLEALKTYPKTVEHLKDEKGYCCLGVALEVYGCTWNERAHANDKRGPVFEPNPTEPYKYLNSGQELSRFGMQVLGLTRGDHDELININDNSPTFEPVIEYIEEHVKELDLSDIADLQYDANA